MGKIFNKNVPQKIDADKYKYIRPHKWDEKRCLEYQRMKEGKWNVVEKDGSPGIGSIKDIIQINYTHVK